MTLLIEKTDHPISPTYDISYKRVVFMRMRDYYGKPCIKFIGVFELTKDLDNNDYVHIFKRVADKVCIDELKQ